MPSIGDNSAEKQKRAILPGSKNPNDEKVAVARTDNFEEKLST
jgi:hypothetical protein